jgi:hypothetical protein
MMGCPNKRPGARARMVKRGYTNAEAMAYLGLKRRAFEKHIRPRLPAPTPCGTSRVFERADLDRAWEAYRKACRATPGHDRERTDVER